MRRLVPYILLLAMALPAWPKTDIRIDPDYDPRVDLRVVVLPAQKDRSLRRVSDRTISAMFSTELLSLYEVLDLLRFEQALEDQRLTLDDAFSVDARSAVRDIAGVDAIASVEIYRWAEGTGGIPFITAESGVIGARLRMMDPYTGRLYWSVNRLDKVSPGTNFLDRATELFRDVIVDLDEELQDRIDALNEADSYAEYLVAQGDWPGLQGFAAMTRAGEGEKGFLPRVTPEVALLQAYKGYGYLPQDSDPPVGVSLDGYEDLENDVIAPPRSTSSTTGSTSPLRAVNQGELRSVSPADTLNGATGDSGTLRPGSTRFNEEAPTLPGLDYLDAPSDSTTSSADGYETTD